MIQSNATAEAASATPDEVADVPADSKIRLTHDDSDTKEAFVKFNISTIDANRLTSAAIYTSAGQHNPSGVARIDPYWVDMYGSNTTDWPDPFTWNSSRPMHKSGQVLASENIQYQHSGYEFAGEALVQWIKAKKAEGATEVTFRFHAREEHPFGVWVNGTYQDGMQMVVEYEPIVDNPDFYTDTIAKINFTFDQNYNEPGWLNVYGSSSFPADLNNGVQISLSGNTLKPGSSGEPETCLPSNVGSTYNFLDKDNNNPLNLTISGLEPSNLYRICFFSSRDDLDASGERNTYFYIQNKGQGEGELLIFDEVFTYDGSLNGFKWFDFWDIIGAPTNWTNPYDYENGEFFERYEVISQPTSRQAALSFGFWQDNGERESLSSKTIVKGPGSVGVRNSSPAGWWESDEENPVDFSRPSDFSHIGFPLWSDESKLVSPWSTDGDWDKRSFYHPMEVRASVVAVPSGKSFSGWDFWLNRDKEVSINPVGNADSLLAISAVTPSSSGEIVVNMSKLVDNYGYINAMIITKQGVTQIDKYSRVEEVRYYPVPVYESLTIENLSGKNFISVYDITGRLVIQKNNQSKKKYTIPMDKLNPGIYIIHIEGEKQYGKTFKIIKK